ncbi:hypothetical protein NLS1_00170 [Nocardioides sp. LS1]|nr:hypothetical protein NLS1_00170 [Nocardioides sp. LS1]
MLLEEIGQRVQQRARPGLPELAEDGRDQAEVAAAAEQHVGARDEFTEALGEVRPAAGTEADDGDGAGSRGRG